MARLRLFLLGPPRVELDKTPIDLQRRKALAMLIYLAVSGQPHSRDALATLFWPDLDQGRGRAYLRRDLATLNTSLPGDWFMIDRETVKVNSEAAVWVDVNHFRRLLAACQNHNHPSEVTCSDCLPLLTEAAALYTGDFLAGFTLKDSPDFDDWQFFQSEGLRQELASGLERLIKGLTTQEDYKTTIPYARRWVALDPWHEPAQRQLMQLYSKVGQKAAALRQYEEYTALLEKELGLPPEEETTTLYEAIKAKWLLAPFIKAEEHKRTVQTRRAAKPAPQPASQSSEPALASPPHSTTETSWAVGREAELAKLNACLAQALTWPRKRLSSVVWP